MSKKSALRNHNVPLPVQDTEISAILNFLNDFADQQVKSVRRRASSDNRKLLCLVERHFFYETEVDCSSCPAISSRLVAPRGLLDTLSELAQKSSEVHPKFFSVKQSTQESFSGTSLTITIPSLNISKLISETEPLESFNKRRKLAQNHSVLDLLKQNLNLEEDGMLIVSKRTNAPNNIMFFELNLDRLFLNAKKNESVKTQILKELKFFHLTPKALKENTLLQVDQPSLVLNLIQGSSVAHCKLSLALQYSVKVYENAFDSGLVTPEVVELLDDLISLPSQSSVASRIKPIPTYYQSGYEYLNEWNPVDSGSISAEQFTKLYGEVLKRGSATRKVGLNKKIIHILDNLSTPSTKLFYNLLTEYASKLQMPTLMYGSKDDTDDEFAENENEKSGKKNSLTIPGLETKLFNFQVETLFWCLDKENVDYDYQENEVRNRPYFDIHLFKKTKVVGFEDEPEAVESASEDSYLYNYNYLSKKIEKILFGWIRFVIDYGKNVPHYRFETLNLADFFEDIPPSNVCWFNKFTGNIISTHSLAEQLQSTCGGVLPDYISTNKKTNQPRYTIDESVCLRPQYFAQNLLSEEMGLGKTIELLALVMTNKRKDFMQVSIDKDTTASLIDDDNYVYDEVSNRYVLKLKTTLIVCPESILSQWIQEMNKFAPSLRILKYEGYNQFYKRLATSTKSKKQNKRKNKKFVVKLKFSPGKVLQNEEKYNIDMLTNYSTFKATGGSLKFTPLIDRLNANTLSLTRFKGLPNVKVETSNFGGEMYKVPVIKGVDQEADVVTAENNDVTEGDADTIDFTELSSDWLMDMLKKDSIKKIETNHKRVAFELSQYDIIVASYQVVTRELHYAQFNPNGRPTRSAAKAVKYNDDSGSEGITRNGIQLSTNRHDYSSPLVLLQFWRIMLDEVQMVSSEVSNAAKTCRIFARCHSWGISGTPIKKDLGDIMSYISFLRISPFDQTGRQRNYYWNMLLNQERSPVDFMKLIVNLAIRHDKAMVKDDIQLPKQNRVLITSSFTAVEQDNYFSLFKDFLNEAGLNAEGEPIVEDWSPNTQLMRKYLTILRKTCCHIDLASKKVFRYGSVTASMNDILKRFLGEAKTKINDLERDNIVLKIELGEIRELLHDPYEFKNILHGSISFVKGKIQMLKSEIEADIKSKKVEKLKIEKILSEEASTDDLENEDEDEDEYRAAKKKRLRAWNELLHKIYFFIANAHYQITLGCRPNLDLSDDQLKEHVAKAEEHGKLVNLEANSDPKDLLTGDDNLKRYIKNKVLEDYYYKKAEKLRDEILTEYTNQTMATIAQYASAGAKLKVKEISVRSVAPKNLKFVSNLQLKSFYFKLFKVVDELDLQATKLNEWFSDINQILCSLLLIKNSDEGDEYDKSVVDQEKAFYILTVLEIALKFRDALLNGVSLTYNNNFIFETVTFDQPIFDEENYIDKSTTLKKQNKEKKDKAKRDHQSESSKELELFKEELKTSVETIRPTICQDGGNTEFCLKHLSGLIKLMKKELGVRTLLTAEQEAIEDTEKRISDLFEQETKAFAEMSKKGLHMLNLLYNSRSRYFFQLQVISDSVQSTDFNKYKADVDDIYELLPELLQPHLEMLDNQIKGKILGNDRMVSQLNSRCMYLDSLRDFQEEGDIVEKEKLCIICQSAIIVGVLTECGHHYCKECLETWIKRHHICPICKAPINKGSIYEFTYTKQKLQIGMINDEGLQNREMQEFDEIKQENDEEQLGPAQDGSPGSQSKRKARMHKKKAEEKFLFYKPMNDKEFNTIDEVKLASKNKFGAKINTILKIILWLKQNNDEVQVVVFSQWEEFLKVVAVALEENGIRFLGTKSAPAEGAAAHGQRGDGVMSALQRARAGRKTGKNVHHRKMLVSDIHRFKYDSSITCFLLNAEQQAAGLTLVNATHVILCEPLVNTAIELQAINRIHRIGQKHETTVWMVGISGSIEESIINLSTKKRINQLSKIRKNEDEMSSHLMDIVGDMSEDKREENQMAVDSADLMGETDKLMDKSGGELVPADELWESFFSKRAPL